MDRRLPPPVRRTERLALAELYHSAEPCDLTWYAWVLFAWLRDTPQRRRLLNITPFEPVYNISCGSCLTI